MKNLITLDISNYKKCNKCKGNGCSLCNKGTYKDNNFIIITKNKIKQLIAFQSEFIGK